MIKDMSRVCPICGEIYIEKNVDKIILGLIDVKMRCPNNHVWIENFSMHYTGYTIENEKFDDSGNKIL